MLKQLLPLLHFYIPYRLLINFNMRIELQRIIAGLVLGLLYMPSFGQTPYGNNSKAGKYIELNGVKQYYETYGKGKPLILIHGNVTGISGWGPQIDEFSKYYSVYAIDCRGRGKSDLGPDSLTYYQMAHDISAFIHELKLDSVAIVGKSDGGIVGIMLGMYFPQHIEKIVAFGANLEPDSTALIAKTVQDAKNERELAEMNLQAGDVSQNWKLIYQRNRMMECQPHVKADELQRIPVPVLVFSCDRDLILVEHSVWIAQHIPKSNLCILPGENHFIAKQNPALFNQTVLNYLRSSYKDESFRFKR